MSVPFHCQNQLGYKHQPNTKPKPATSETMIITILFLDICLGSDMFHLFSDELLLNRTSTVSATSGPERTQTHIVPMSQPTEARFLAGCIFHGSLGFAIVISPFDCFLVSLSKTDKTGSPRHVESPRLPREDSPCFPRSLLRT